jgi:hypothetical protein
LHFEISRFPTCFACYNIAPSSDYGERKCAHFDFYGCCGTLFMTRKMSLANCVDWALMWLNGRNMTKKQIGSTLVQFRSKLTELLTEQNVELMTTLKKNMKPKVIAAFDKLILRKRSIIETSNDQLKSPSISNIPVIVH